MSQNQEPPPTPPDKPEPADCCGGGCVVCVYDAYEPALERYLEALAAWHARHANN
ncbi:MAG: oxidoreductase-like domain-containing protein [Pseudoxanthomonas sp.]